MFVGNQAMTVGVPARMEIADGPDKHTFLLMQMPTQLDTPFSLLQLRRVLNQKGSNPIPWEAQFVLQDPALSYSSAVFPICNYNSGVKGIK
jgi:hypothetical protein